MSRGHFEIMPRVAFILVSPLFIYIYLFICISYFVLQGKTGDLGHVTADTAGRAQFRLIRNGFNVWDVVGRSMVMHETSNNTPEGDTRYSLISINVSQPTKDKMEQLHE